MTLPDYLTAISGFRMNAAGNIEPVAAEDLKELWQRLHLPAGGSGG
jgi:hypothetical protein